LKTSLTAASCGTHVTGTFEKLVAHLGGQSPPSIFLEVL